MEASQRQAWEQPEHEEVAHRSSGAERVERDVRLHTARCLKEMTEKRELYVRENPTFVEA